VAVAVAGCGNCGHFGGKMRLIGALLTEIWMILGGSGWVAVAGWHLFGEVSYYLGYRWVAGWQWQWLGVAIAVILVFK
jgi:hypothetical protein